MASRDRIIVLLSLALYGVGLYGFWELLNAGKVHWALGAFPCALLGLCVVPFLERATKPVMKPEVVDEDRSE
jgi:hypothetical protein